MTNPARNPLWPGEVDALISACTTAQEKLVILALLETGMTADELGRLTSSAIAGHACTVERATGVVQVRLSAELQEMLRVHFRSTAEFGMGKRHIQRIVRAVGKRAGLTKIVTPDILRRTSLWNPIADDRNSCGNGRILLEAAERASDIILVADDNGRLVDVNQAASGAFGLPKAAKPWVPSFWMRTDGPCLWRGHSLWPQQSSVEPAAFGNRGKWFLNTVPGPILFLACMFRFCVRY